MVELIPAFSLLGFISLVVLIILFKFSSTEILSLFEGVRLLVCVTGLLVALVILLHLFKEQPWTADILKVLIGVLVGTGAAGVITNKKEGGVEANNTKINNSTVVGRDYFDQKIETLESELATIQNAVITQNNNISSLDRDAEYGYLVNSIYERGSGISTSMTETIRYWESKGWSFYGISSDYNGADGMFILFRRKLKNNDSKNRHQKVQYYHGSQREKFV